MTTSGEVNVELTLADVLTMSARLVNAVGRNQALSGAMLLDFKKTANLMVKHWQGMPGSHCWTTVEGTLFPKPGQYQYRAGPSATDHITQTFYQTAVTADETLGQTLISVDSTADMTVADNIGIVLDDGTLHWSTVSAKTSTTVTIAGALPDSAAAGNAVFNYTNRISRPLNVLAARRYDIATRNEIPILPEARLDFRALPSKRDAGTIVSLFYDKLTPQGVFNIWRIPAAVTELVNFTWNRPLESYLTNSDTSDFPQEWQQALVWNLAELKIPEFPVTPADAAHIRQNAARFLDEVMGADRENESVFVGPDLSGYR